MKIIISRKGLDSSFGTTPSPILPDGRLCWLPIPEKTSYKPTLPTYNDLAFDGICLGTMIEELSNSRIRGTDTTHLDPDLFHGYRARLPGWRPAFGQAGAAESHLRRQNVGPGDIFLFFAWFREAQRVNGKWQFAPRARDLHVLFGWLQIDERTEFDLNNECLPFGEPRPVPDWMKQHPHLIGERYGPLDVVYTSTRNLVINGEPSRIRGAGLFPRRTTATTLTDENQSRSIWRLPRWFFPSSGRPPLSYHEKEDRWNIDGDNTILRVASRGQEFVLDADKYPEATSWLQELFYNGVGL
ncbi:MAG: hypothetical protein KDJ30_05745 [Rhodoblastus sp.]|nr:hypothetical protein [Rhodoblastus sp.]